MSKAWQGGSTRSWRRVRAAVLQRDGHRCQLKLDGCEVRADQVHHTRNRQLVGDNPEFLVAACGPCNRAAGEPGRHDPAPAPRQWWQQT